MTLEYRLSGPDDAQRVLDFVEANGFNPRDVETWRGLDMDAATAWEGDELVGAIPFQLRPLLIRPGEVRMVAHETTVAVEADRRSAGIGRAMQDFLKSEPFGAAWLTVYRELPDSPAYRFYQRNGFEPIDPIVSWFAPQPFDSAEDSDRAVVIVDPDDAPHDDLDAFRRRVFADRPGSVDRTWRPLQRWLAVHPYRARYRFAIAMVVKNDSITASAVLGIGKLHSDTERIDILEVADTDGAAEGLLSAVVAHAATAGLEPIRWPLSGSDPHTELVRGLGWEPGWSFEHMIHPLDGTSIAELRALAHTWRYQSLDYI